MEASSSAGASGSRSGLPSTPTRKSGGWSSVQGSPITSSRGTKRSRTGLDTDRVTRSHRLSDSDEEEDEEDEEDDVEDSPSKGKGKNKRGLTTLEKQEKALSQAKEQLRGVARPDSSAPREEHQNFLDKWCEAWFDKGKANNTNKRYLRPTLATSNELREKSKEAGSIWWMWRCKFCRTYYILKPVELAGSGSSLKYHADRCKSNPANVDNGTGLLQTTIASTTTLGPAVRELETRHAIVAWIARNNHSFSVVDQPGFKEMFTRSYPELKQVLPSRKTVASDLTKVHKVNEKRLLGHFKAHDGAFHIAVDGWTDRQNKSFLGVHCHWNVIEGSEITPRSMLIDFIDANAPHTGEYLAQLLSKSLTGWGIQDQVLSVICDNASANDVMVKKLASHEWKRFGEGGCVRCFAHVLNLVVGAIIEGATGMKWSDNKWEEMVPDFDPEIVAADASVIEEIEEFLDIDDHDEHDFVVDQPILDRIALARVPDTQHVVPSQIAEALKAAGRVKDTPKSITKEETTVIAAGVATRVREHQALVASALEKCRSLAKRLRCRSLWRRRWDAAADALFSERKIQTGARKIPMDVQTRWNSTWETIRACIENEIVVKRFYTLMEVKDQPEEERLTADEFTALRQLEPILKLLNACTKRFSTATEAKVDKAFIAGVIPVMDAITVSFDKLKSQPGDEKAAVKYGIRRGQMLLDRYYSKTDESVLYRIALLLHPAYRLAYMKRARWPDAWQEEAKRLGREMWEKHYRLAPEQKAADPNDQMEFDELDMLIDKAAATPVDGPDEFDSFINATKADVKVPPFNDSALVWWAHQPKLGGLRSMALDVLGTPATSVDVERAFSKAGLMFSSRRTRLDPDTSKAQMCVGDWMKHDFLSEKAFVDVFKQPGWKTTERKVGGAYKPAKKAAPKKKKTAVIVLSGDEEEVSDMEVD